MVPGGFDDREFNVTKQRIVGDDKRKIDRNALVHGGAAKRSATPSRLAWEAMFFANSQEVILAVGMLDVRQACSAFVRQRPGAARDHG